MFFRLFSFLADKTGGWKIFVQPKLLFGTMILGFGVAACNYSGKATNNNDTIASKTIDTLVDCYVGCYESPEPPDTIINPDSAYHFVPVRAEFPGGDKEMMKWLQNNVNYPEIAVKDSIQGKVFVNFIVLSDGSINNVRIARSAHPLLDNEAIRLVKSMPKWKAGQKDGVDVHSYFTLPVTFVLKN